MTTIPPVEHDRTEGDPTFNPPDPDVDTVISPAPSFLAQVDEDDARREATRAGLLAEVKNARAVRAAAEVAVLHSIVDWCTAHEALGPDEAMWIAGYGEHGLALGGPGCPLVRESAITELSAALGVSTQSGADQAAVVLELRYRLPRLWARVVSGACPVWRARLVAEKTMHLCAEGAAQIDTHVAHYAHAISYAQLSRLADEALMRWDPAAAEEKRRAAADQRHCDIRLADHSDGVVQLDAGLDLADALALEHAIRERAHTLATDGSLETLDVRRSQALGSLAVGQPTLPDAGDSAQQAPAPPPAGPAGKHLVIYTHIAAGAIDPLLRGPTEDVSVARLDNRHPARGPLTTTQVREWARTAARITVRPVLDLAETIHCDSYECSDRLKDQTVLRDATCVFPWCTRPAINTDMEHVVPYPQGPTETGNIAPACRVHHRAKTHQGWRYEALGPATYLWTSPVGERYLRTHAGTHPIDVLPPGPPPDPLPEQPGTDPYRPAPLVPETPGTAPPGEQDPPPF